MNTVTQTKTKGVAEYQEGKGCRSCSWGVKVRKTRYTEGIPDPSTIEYRCSQDGRPKPCQCDEESGVTPKQRELLRRVVEGFTKEHILMILLEKYGFKKVLQELAEVDSQMIDKEERE